MSLSLLLPSNNQELMFNQKVVIINPSALAAIPPQKTIKC